jgi:hypothetical protein
MLGFRKCRIRLIPALICVRRLPFLVDPYAFAFKLEFGSLCVVFIRLELSFLSSVVKISCFLQIGLLSILMFFSGNLTWVPIIRLILVCASEVEGPRWSSGPGSWSARDRRRGVWSKFRNSVPFDRHIFTVDHHVLLNASTAPL